MQGNSLFVGNGAFGRLEVNGGSTFSTGTDSSKVLFVGYNGPDASGEVLVTGDGSSVETYNFTAGLNGEAHVTVEAGSLLDVAHDLIINNYNNTGNSILITGTGTLATVGRALSLNNGSSLMTLTIDDHAMLGLSGSGNLVEAGTTDAIARIVDSGSVSTVSTSSNTGLILLGTGSSSNATLALDHGGSIVSGWDFRLDKEAPPTAMVMVDGGSSLTGHHYLEVGYGRLHRNPHGRRRQLGDLRLSLHDRWTCHERNRCCHRRWRKRSPYRRSVADRGQHRFGGNAHSR